MDEQRLSAANVRLHEELAEAKWQITALIKVCEHHVDNEVKLQKALDASVSPVAEQITRTVMANQRSADTDAATLREVIGMLDAVKTPTMRVGRAATVAERVFMATSMIKVRDELIEKTHAEVEAINQILDKAGVPGRDGAEMLTLRQRVHRLIDARDTAQAIANHTPQCPSCGEYVEVHGG